MFCIFYSGLVCLTDLTWLTELVGLSGLVENILFSLTGEFPSGRSIYVVCYSTARFNSVCHIHINTMVYENYVVRGSLSELNDYVENACKVRETIDRQYDELDRSSVNGGLRNE